MSPNTFDQNMMRLALEAAQSINPEDCAPNPRVGAVIVEAGEVVSTGYHAFNGGPHAEVEALKNLGRVPKSGAIMYVTLEPCSTHGRTGACTDRIIGTKAISRVVIGAIDPNPAHRGHGVKVLEAAGIEVTTACLTEECEALNPEFNRLMREKPAKEGG